MFHRLIVVNLPHLHFSAVWNPNEISILIHFNVRLPLISGERWRPFSCNTIKNLERLHCFEHEQPSRNQISPRFQMARVYLYFYLLALTSDAVVQREST